MDIAPCSDPACYFDMEHRHLGVLFAGHQRYLVNPIQGEKMATAPNTRPAVKVANTVTLQKDGPGQRVTMGDLRAFVNAAEKFADEAVLRIEFWDDQREGMHTKVEVTE